jgi:uncharacterized protein YkwD
MSEAGFYGPEDETAVIRTPQAGRAAAAAAALVAVACGGARDRARTVTAGFVRYGEDRGRIGYAEREAAAKKKLFRRINADRAAYGAPPVEYDLLAAKVGDVFCLDAARGNFVGHWDLAGRPPYLRWALAGGVDFHGQNAGSVSRKGLDIVPGEIAALLLESHERMMEERPPDDGHRRAILDPKWTHVGIGVAWERGEFRMTEEFVRRVAEWVEVPAGPVAAGSGAPFRAKLPSGWSAGVIEVAFEGAPAPMTREEILRRDRYGLPPAFQTLLPVLPPRVRYEGGGTGEFPVSGGRIEARIPLSKGPGSYYVLLFAEKGSPSPGRKLTPVVAARIEAR